MLNLSSFVNRHARSMPGRTAIRYEDRNITWSDFCARVEATAAWLAAEGIGAGDVVAVLMKNSPAFLEICIGSSHVGAIFLPINYRLADEEILYILRNSEAKLLFIDDDIHEEFTSTTRTYRIDAASRAEIRTICGSGTIGPTPRQETDLFRLMYTSGTTDRPKGVLHSYRNYYWRAYDHAACLGLGPETRLLVCGPLYHVGAMDLPGTAVLLMGGMLRIQREFDAQAVLASIEADQLTGAWFAPVMTSMLLSSPDRERYALSSFRWAVGGGERTPEARIREFTQLFRNARYIDAYGLTETSSGDTLMPAGSEYNKIGSTGCAVQHVEIEIRTATGRPLPAGHEGEICVRGPKVTTGYWRDPERTASAFWEDWLRTGDVGYLDVDGFLFLTDRKKDMIISGGENIASSEVERVIYGLPGVAEVAVIGAPDDRWGERPIAIVALKEGETLTLDALQEHCRQKLARFKIPKDLHILERLPRNPSGKVLKRELRVQLGWD